MGGDVSDWRAKIRVGDVLEAPSGDLRVVREVTRWKRRGRTTTIVTFAIRRCSWTRRCYTVVNQSDLATRGFRPTGKRVRLSKPIDRAISRAIDEPRPDRSIGCRAVQGVP